jgi:hypothetical protein
MQTLAPTLKPLWLPDMLPNFQFAFETRVLTGQISKLPSVNGANCDLLMMNIEGGDICGPMLNGTVLPGGTEWPLVRPDGVSRIDARYSLQADDGTVIGVRNTGFRRGPPDVMARLLSRKEVVDARSYYFRTWSMFDAPAGPHAWMASSVFVGVGERHPNVLFLRYYAML